MPRKVNLTLTNEGLYRLTVASHMPRNKSVTVRKDDLAALIGDYGRTLERLGRDGYTTPEEKDTD